jgi:hypothetical protein
MIDPVSPADLQEAVRASLRDWWSPPFPSPQRFKSSEYLAYTVLTMCRSLYVLEYGRIASKPEAARWALKTLNTPWIELVRLAHVWQDGMAIDELNGTFEFIHYTLLKAGILPENKNNTLSRGMEYEPD